MQGDAALLADVRRLHLLLEQAVAQLAVAPVAPILLPDPVVQTVEPKTVGSLAG